VEGKSDAQLVARFSFYQMEVKRCKRVLPLRVCTRGAGRGFPAILQNTLFLNTFHVEGQQEEFLFVFLLKISKKSQNLSLSARVCFLCCFCARLAPCFLCLAALYVRTFSLL